MTGLNFQAMAGLVCLIGLAWAFSDNKRHVIAHGWPLVGVGVAVQFALALMLTQWTAARQAVAALNRVVAALQDATQEGTALVFGYLGGGPLPFEPDDPGATYILAFQALPLMLVISALAALFWHWRILPGAVEAIAWPLRRAFGLSGPLGVGCGSNVFIGMVEAPLLIRPTLKTMPRSDLFVLMTTGMATIAGTVLILYASFLDGVIDDPLGHIVVASLISLPAAILVARVMVPPDVAESANADKVVWERPYHSSFDALAQGTQTGISLVLNVAAMLIVLVALVTLGNSILGLLPDIAGAPLTFERMLAFVLRPVAWGLGVPWSESGIAAELIGEKTILNELFAYLHLSQLEAGTISERTGIILTYALCGFANPGSLGILLGGFLTMVPERREDILDLAPRSLISGTLATLMTGAVMGVIL